MYYWATGKERPEPEDEPAKEIDETAGGEKDSDNKEELDA